MLYFVLEGKAIRLSNDKRARRIANSSNPTDCYTFKLVIEPVVQRLAESPTRGLITNSVVGYSCVDTDVRIHHHHFVFEFLCKLEALLI